MKKFISLFLIIALISACSHAEKKDEVKENTLNNKVVYEDGTWQELIIEIDYHKFYTSLEKVEEKDIDQIKILGTINYKVKEEGYYDTDCANFDAVVGQNYGKLGDNYVAYWYDTWYIMYPLIDSLPPEIRIEDKLFYFFQKKYDQQEEIIELGTIKETFENANQPLTENETANFLAAQDEPYGKSGENYLINIGGTWYYLEDSGLYFNENNELISK